MRPWRRLFGWRRRNDPFAGIKETDDESYSLPVVDDPLDAIGIELRLAAERLKEKRDLRRLRAQRLRRDATVVATTLFVLVAVTGGASAVGVEVPVVRDALDTLFDSRDPATDPPLDRGATFKPPPGLASIPSGHDRSSGSLEVPVAGGSAEVVGAAFVATGGYVCFKVQTRGKDDRAGGRTILGCSAPAMISQRLASDTVFISGFSFGGPTIVAGFADASVEAIGAHGPDGELTVALTDPWTPNERYMSRFRAFLAASHTGLHDKGDLDSEKLDRLMDRSRYSISARLEDGRTVAVRP